MKKNAWRKKWRGKGNFHQTLTPILFILPAFLIFTIYIILPFIQGIRISLMDWGVFTEGEYVGLKNFQQLASDKVFRITVRNTLVYSAATVILLTVNSLILALLFQNNGMFGIKFFRVASYIPSLLSMITVGIAWRFILGDQMGVLNYLIRSWGGKGVKWLTDRNTAMLSVIFVSLWAQSGYYMVVMLSGLQAIPETLYEAAQIDGATKHDSFWYITLPLLKSTILAVLVLSTISAFKAYELITVMTNGGPGYSTKLIVQQIYQLAFVEDRMGYASAMSIVLMLIIGLFTLIQFRIMGKSHDYE